jgi:hypothetical protein
VLGLYWTLAGPVQVSKGREWSLSGFRERCGDERRDSADGGRRLLFEAGAALGAHRMKVRNRYGTPCLLNQVTDEFAALCAETAVQTTAAIVYELVPFDANVNSVDKAWRSWREPTPITRGPRSTPGIWESSGFPPMASARSRRNSCPG